MSRTVLHGIDQSGTDINKRPRSASDGFTWWQEDARRQWTYSEANSIWVPSDGQPYIAGNELFDDFNGSTRNPLWSTAKGSDAQAILPTVLGNGLIRLTSGDAGTGIAADGSAISYVVGFPGEYSELYVDFLFKGQLSAGTNVYAFLGVTDTAVGSTLEEPASLSGATYTTTATDAAGFLIDTAATTDTVRLVGVANNVDATHVDTGIALSGSALNFDYRLRLYPDNSARFYSGTTLLATITGAFTASASPHICAIVGSRSTASRNLDLDFMAVNRGR